MTGGTPLIRPAQAEDWQTLRDFNCALASETEGKTLDPQIAGAGVRALLADPSKGRYLVATVEGRIAGQLMHTREWSDWRNGDIWWLQSVYIHPDFRRQGLFRLLYSTLEAQAQADPGVVGLRLYVEDHNTHAQETYAALGMHRPGYFVLEKMLRRQV